MAIEMGQAGPLQANIQKKLSEYGYSTEDDHVMAEYVTVMLANSKTSDQITSELSDLIGPDYDSSFTSWIFDTAVPEYYRSTGQQIPPATPSSAMSIVPQSADGSQSGFQPASPSTIETVGDSRESFRGQDRRGGAGGPRDRRARGFNEGGLPPRPHGVPYPPRGARGADRGVFGTAVAGLKRGPDESDRPGRRPRMSNEGPGGRGAFENGDGPHGGKSIFERAGVRPGSAQPNNFNNMGGQGVMHFANGNGHRAGPAAPAFPSVPGLPPLHIPDNFNSLPPAQQQAIQQQIFQHQLIAAAAAQQMYAGPGNQQNRPMAFSGPDGGDVEMSSAQAPTPAQPSRPVQLPTRPASQDLCKYGVECKNAICKYSHPSPAATKESGLVLSNEVCQKNLDCEDKDCPRSHVSPAQKTDPEGKNVSQYAQKAAPRVAAPKMAAQSAPIAAPNPGAKPCMFGANCTRPGCYFSHPSASAAIPCKFGAACTRADCHFSHPPGHRKPFASNTFQKRNMSATFGASSASATATPGIVGKDDVNIDDGKMSARMKKFMETPAPAERERIVSGEMQTDDNSKADKDDLEVVM